MANPTPFRDPAKDLAVFGRGLVGHGVAFDSFDRDDEVLLAGSLMTSGASWDISQLDEISEDSFSSADPITKVVVEDGLLNFRGPGKTAVLCDTDGAVFEEVAIEVVWQPGTTDGSRLLFGSSWEESTSDAIGVGVYLGVSPGVPDEPNDPDDFYTGTVGIYLWNAEDPLPDPVIEYTEQPIRADGLTRHRYSIRRTATEDLRVDMPDGHRLFTNDLDANSSIDSLWGGSMVLLHVQPLATYSTDRVPSVAGISSGPPSRSWTNLPHSGVVSVDPVEGLFTLDHLLTLGEPDYIELVVVEDSTCTDIGNGSYSGQILQLSALEGVAGSSLAWPANIDFVGGAGPVLGQTQYDWATVTLVYNAVDTVAGAWVEIGRASNDSTVYAAAKPVVAALVEGAHISTDFSLGSEFTVTLAGDRIIDNPTNPVNGASLTYRLKQDGTGTRVPSWGAAFRFSGGTAPTLTTTAAATDYVGFVYNSTDSKWDCVSTALNF